MFIGEYLHTLDPKNRISLPAKFRKDLGRAVVMTRGLDHCLSVYPKKAWQAEAESRAVHASGTAAGGGGWAAGWGGAGGGGGGNKLGRRVLQKILSYIKR